VSEVGNQRSQAGRLVDNHLSFFLIWSMPLLILFLVLLSSIPCLSQTLNESPDQIWEAGDRRWTVEEEYRFGKWVNEDIEENFFIHHKISTDCADAVYAIRWIYARWEKVGTLVTILNYREGRSELKRGTFV
jgi:hypothetical protein